MTTSPPPQQTKTLARKLGHRWAGSAEGPGWTLLRPSLKQASGETQGGGAGEGGRGEETCGSHTPARRIRSLLGRSGPCSADPVPARRIRSMLSRIRSVAHAQQDPVRARSGCTHLYQLVSVIIMCSDASTRQKWKKE